MTGSKAFRKSKKTDESVYFLPRLLCAPDMNLRGNQLYQYWLRIMNFSRKFIDLLCMSFSNILVRVPIEEIDLEFFLSRESPAHFTSNIGQKTIH